jgi:Domain of unknown function (DUF6898)
MPGPAAGTPCTKQDEVIFEIRAVGPILRVAAVHVPSLVEVVVQGPAGAGAAALKRLARDKLAFVLERLRQGHPTDRA